MIYSEQNGALQKPMTQGSKISAGILAFRRTRDLEFLLAHPGGPYWRKRDEGAWSIPKGQVESGNLLACARREFNEETGFVATGPFVILTPRRQKSGKLVHVFAVEADFDINAFCSNSFEMEWPPHSGNIQRFPEIDRIAYFDAPAARKVILHEQRDFIDELQKKISEQKN
jgi:predicted NUDIX family NTP pyrophosphohydrolase